MVKKFDIFALVTSIVALTQPFLWIVAFLFFHLAQGETVEEIIGGFFIGLFSCFVLSILSFILIFAHNKNNKSNKIASVARIFSMIGMFPFPIVFMLWIVVNCLS